MKRPPAMSRPRPRRDGSLTMAHGWLILADDLTGAADCAIAFGRRGHAAVGDVGRDRRCSGSPACRFWPMMRRAEALRPRPPRAATPMCWRACPSRDVCCSRKSNSTLRGQPAAEIAAALAHLKSRSGSAFGVFAPAFPATGRTTVDGRVRVKGRRARGDRGLAARPQLSQCRSRRRSRHRGRSQREGQACDRARWRSQGDVFAGSPARAI